MTKIEEKLKEKIEKEKKYEELWSSWILNKKVVSQIIALSIEYYPNFSRHNELHSESILKNIERILSEKTLDSLSPTDLWLILHCAYLHDFGMNILYEEVKNTWLSNEFIDFLEKMLYSTDYTTNKAARVINKLKKKELTINAETPIDIKLAVTTLTAVFYRDRHADKSNEYIQKAKELWELDFSHNNIIIKRLLKILGSICSLHTKEFENILGLHKEENGYDIDYIHPRFIAILIRLGDALDLDNGRFFEYNQKVLGELPKSSKIHYDKHESINHILITSKEIMIEAKCEDYNVYKQLRSELVYIKNEINNANIYWNEISIFEFDRLPTLKEPKINYNDNGDLAKYQDLQLTISNKEAFKIIEGSDIYKDKFACLREIIQNSEDALKLQLWNDIVNDRYFDELDNNISKKSHDITPYDITRTIYNKYHIDVIVEQIDDTENAEVIIIDNGIGISLDDISAISEVGYSNSKTQKKELIESMPVWLKPTANFGIGLQSIFLITEEFEIISRPYSSDKVYKYHFTSGTKNGYISTEYSNEKMNYGTKIRFIIHNKNFSYTLGGLVDNNIRTFDPFGTTCSVIYKVLDEVRNNCDSSFFKIKLLSKTGNFENEIKPLFSNINTELITIDNENTNKYKFENLICYLWYKNNYYRVAILDNDYPGLRICFKGKGVSHSINKILKGLSIDIDLYSFETSEALSLNREKLKNSINNLILEDLEFVINFYFKTVSYEEILKTKNKNIIINYVIYCKGLKVNLPNHFLIDYLKEIDFDCIKFNREKYENTTISLIDFLKIIDRSFYFYNRDSMNENIEKIKEEICKKLNSENANDKNISNFKDDDEYKSIEKIILMDKYLGSMLSIFRSVKYYLISNSNFIFNRFYINDDICSYNAISKNRIIQNLVYKKINGIYTMDYEMRQAVPVIKEFEVLSTKVHDLYYLNFPIQSNHYMISPISLENFNHYNEYEKEDDFIKYIINTKEFMRLVDYTVKNSEFINKENVYEINKKLIEENYIKLIKVFLKEKNNNI